MRVLSVCVTVVGSLSVGFGIAASAAAAEPRLMAALGNNVLTMTDVAPKHTQVSVDDKPVFEDKESAMLSFVGAYSLKDRWIALFQADTGAKDCPTRFRILELGGTQPMVSFPFGSCSDAAQVSIDNDTLTVSMPQPGGGGEAAWTYRNGKVGRSR
ncbi:hypothetical protein [Azospirillum sp. B510]|uniref:hypothetical protein n=1 Tax=Azospirillum sp. (strain B510) TaxID=137722 RepID=UPI002000276E|nr:hypothetical protein [Azospirillum sp. B510]